MPLNIFFLCKQDEATSLLRTATSRASAGACKWAWLRLGLQQVRSGSFDDAILSLQAAVRADPSDVYVFQSASIGFILFSPLSPVFSHCIESLGDAYLSRGSFTASLKCFTRASQLQPDNIYSRYQ